VITSGMDERDERKRTSEDASKRTWTTSKPESSPCSGISVEDTYLLTTRCPVFRRRDSHLGFRMELETLAGHAKGKGTSGRPARPKVPMGQSGADRPIGVMKRGNARGAKGVGHSRRCWVNGRPEEPSFFAGRRQPSLSGTSRMRRESHVRICERLGVKVPGPTRRKAQERSCQEIIACVLETFFKRRPAIALAKIRQKTRGRILENQARESRRQEIFFEKILGERARLITWLTRHIT
jgi:hypothetical protein